ncbi:MAG: aldehyde dehydrogenase [Clostridia bacterium]|nr:aldehyde dehydrogenase [Clostridia bacterium]
MTKNEISQIVKNQREYFDSCKTLNVKYRIEMLKKLKDAIKTNESAICEAIKKDLGKSDFESYMCEVGLTLSEISYMIKHTKKFAKEKTVITPLPQFASRSFVKKMPYGVVLVMSPWNYPFLLTVGPLADAIAAGNTVVVKPSAYSPHTSQIIKVILESVFDSGHVAVIEGGREENTHLLDEKFDYIFFTGGKTVGKLVMEKASKHLTPITLELGGKSPCIVDNSAKLKLAAKRIVFGKYLNLGQTCVAPDYILCQKDVKDEFVGYLKEEIKKQYGSNPLDNRSYGKIINKKHFDKIVSLLDSSKVCHGGGYDESTLKIEPTILDNVTFEDAVMQEEIFGPLLPVVTFETIDEVQKYVNANPKPLAFYIFSSDRKNIKQLTSNCSFGGGCINDTVIHLATSYMGFGGVGESGMGSYHGKCGFDTFSHKKSIVDKKTFIDLPMRYQPYKKFYGKLLKMFLK